MKKLLTMATILVSLTTYSGTLGHDAFFPPSIADNSIQDEDNRANIISNTQIYSDNSISSINTYASEPTEDLAFYSEFNLTNGNQLEFDQFGFPISRPSPGSTFNYESDVYILQPNQTYGYTFTATAVSLLSTPIYYLDYILDGVEGGSFGTPLVETDLGDAVFNYQHVESGVLFSTDDHAAEFSFMLVGQHSLNTDLDHISTTFRLTNLNNNTDFNQLLQQPQNQPIPEPTTFALFGIGIVIIGIYLRMVP